MSVDEAEIKSKYDNGVLAKVGGIAIQHLIRFQVIPSPFQLRVDQLKVQLTYSKAVAFAH